MLETECTGDFGLSDCLFVTQEAEDYADSWFTGPGYKASASGLNNRPEPACGKKAHL